MKAMPRVTQADVQVLLAEIQRYLAAVELSAAAKDTSHSGSRKAGSSPGLRWKEVNLL